MDLHSKVCLRRAALAAGLFGALLAATSSWADRGSDDERCTTGQALRLVNGKIHTMDDKNRVVSSVVIRNGRFTAVGHGGGGGGGGLVRGKKLRGRPAVARNIPKHKKNIPP